MDPISPTGRKHKFAPRKPKPHPKPPKTEASDEREKEEEEEDSAADRATQARLRRWNKQIASRKPGAGRKSSVQVAFGPGGSSPPLRTFGAGKGTNSGKSSGSASKYFADEQNDLTHSSSAIGDEKDTSIIDFTDDATDASTCKIKKAYKEPWDYNSNYPITLPLRKPNSGDPEILDEEEFGENVEYEDEDAINPAVELGLLEKSEQQRMLFFELPAPLPLENKSVSLKGKEKATSTAATGQPPKPGTCALKDLPKGFLGKMLIYKSGAIKLKLGEMLYDVSPGSKCDFAQDVVVMNTAQKDCCVLGELSKKVVVIPDLDSLEL